LSGHGKFGRRLRGKVFGRATQLNVRIHISPTTRQISILKIPVIFDLNHSLQGFDKPGVPDVGFRYPFDICNIFVDFDSW